MTALRAAPVLEKLIVWSLGAALVYAALQQGAFYAEDFAVVLAVLGVTVPAVIPGLVRARGANPFLIPAAILVLVGAWALVSATVNADATDALGYVALTTAVATALVAPAQLGKARRDTLRLVLIAAGCLVAVTSWVGVAWHYADWAAPSQSLWRGASTLTYANAAAALLLAPIVLAVDEWLRRPHWAYVAALLVLCTGWTATLSRGGGLSIVITGAIAISLLRADQRRRLLSLWPLVPAVALASIALVPSMPEDGGAAPGWAIAGALAGGATLFALWRVPGRIAVPAVGVIAMVGAGMALWHGAGEGAVERIVETRLATRSEDRSDLSAVTWNQFAASPLVGVGPGNIDFEYVNHAGDLVKAEFTHNEFLQTAAETGVPGVVLVVTALGLVVGHCLQRRTVSASLAVALVAGFAVQSSLDFLWHIPAIPLFIAATVGTLATAGGVLSPRTVVSPAEKQETPHDTQEHH